MCMASLCFWINYRPTWYATNHMDLVCFALINHRLPPHQQRLSSWGESVKRWMHPCWHGKSTSCFPDMAIASRYLYANQLHVSQTWQLHPHSILAYLYDTYIGKDQLNENKFEPWKMNAPESHKWQLQIITTIKRHLGCSAM